MTTPRPPAPPWRAPVPAHDMPDLPPCSIDWVREFPYRTPLGEVLILVNIRWHDNEGGAAALRLFVNPRSGRVMRALQADPHRPDPWRPLAVDKLSGNVLDLAATLAKESEESSP